MDRSEERSVQEEDGDKDGDLLKKEMTLNDTDREMVMYGREKLYHETRDVTLLELCFSAVIKSQHDPACLRKVTDRVVPPRERLSRRIDERVMSLFKQQCVDDAYIAYWKIKNSFVLCESLKKRK